MTELNTVIIERVMKMEEDIQKGLKEIEGLVQ